MKCDQRYLNLYFQVHQPRRLRKFQFFDIGSEQGYFDDALNGDIVRGIARRCYIPANDLLLKLITRHSAVKVTFSLSGTALEQFELFAPEVVESFRRLAETGSVEFLGETYFHSLASIKDSREFIAQIRLHQHKLQQLIGVTPTFFRNTELIYSDAIGRIVSTLGYDGIYVDDAKQLLKAESSNNVYRHPCEPLLLVPRNSRLSDDVAFRYSDKSWAEWPVTGGKFASWIQRLPEHERFICLGMDYETFGEHKKASSGILSFLEEFIRATLETKRVTFLNPSGMRQAFPHQSPASTQHPISWADDARDLSAWLGNDMQRDAFESLYGFQRLAASKPDNALLDAYRHLQTSDHFYYMSTKKGADGSVHQYFSPYKSPYEAFMNFMNVLADLEFRLKGTIQGVSRPFDAEVPAQEEVFT